MWLERPFDKPLARSNYHLTIWQWGSGWKCNYGDQNRQNHWIQKNRDKYQSRRTRSGIKVYWVYCYWSKDSRILFLIRSIISLISIILFLATTSVWIASTDLTGLSSRHDFWSIDTFAGEQTKLNIIHNKCASNSRILNFKLFLDSTNRFTWIIKIFRTNPEN